MRKKTAILLIVMLLSYHINVFAEVLKKDGMNNFNSEDSEYPVATDSQAEREDDVAGKPGEETEVLIEDGTYNVSFPANVQAYLDPGNLSGKGQIFSDPYVIENYGSEDVSIKIKNIAVNYWSDEYEYEFSEETVTDQDSDIKKLNINMIWENESEHEKKVLRIVESEPDEYVLHLKASEYDKEGEFVTLHDGSTGLFYFEGTLNSNPNLTWENGEITLNFDYEIVGNESRREGGQLSEAEKAVLGEGKPQADEGKKEDKTEGILNGEATPEETRVTEETETPEETKSIEETETPEETETTVETSSIETSEEPAQETESPEEHTEEERIGQEESTGTENKNEEEGRKEESSEEPVKEPIVESIEELTNGSDEKNGSDTDTKINEQTADDVETEGMEHDRSDHLEGEAFGYGETEEQGERIAGSGFDS